jgi:hypothetical protein
MSKPKLHHYVPQFYLRCFADEKACLWVWERGTHEAFRSTPKAIGAETHFYRMPELVGTGEDPSFLEEEFSLVESGAHLITNKWLKALPHIQWSDGSIFEGTDKQKISLFLALQCLRTAEQRDILGAFAEQYCYRRSLSDDEKANLHGHMLWHSDLANDLAEGIADSIWIFGHNKAQKSFLTSDNPVAFKKHDNSMWLKAVLLSPQSYLVWPLSPTLVVYCKPRAAWKKVERFDGCVSPVEFTKSMVDHENSGQVFMAKRFLFSAINDFNYEAEFASSIGTDRYAR